LGTRTHSFYSSNTTPVKKNTGKPALGKGNARLIECRATQASIGEEKG